MPKTKKVTLKILSLLILSDILETFLHFFFKKSVLPEADFMVNSLPAAFMFVKAALSSPFLWAGFGIVLAIFTVWSTILSKIDLSVAVPVASLSYILVPLASLIFLHEDISALRWLGIFLIITGVVFVSTDAGSRKGAPS